MTKGGDRLTVTNLSRPPRRNEPDDLPPQDAPVTVVRPVRLPYELDALVRALADARGVSMSSLIRDWIAAGLATAGQVPDPVTEIRRGLDTAQRALDALAAPPKAARPSARTTSPTHEPLRESRRDGQGQCLRRRRCRPRDGCHPGHRRPRQSQGGTWPPGQGRSSGRALHLDPGARTRLHGVWVDG